MTTLVKAFVTAILAVAPVILYGQEVAQKVNEDKREEKKEEKKDTQFVLLCAFEHGSGRVPKDAFTWDPPEHKVVMISQVDTTVRSCVPGEVVTVQANEEGKYEIVIFYKDHYFWYNNVE